MNSTPRTNFSELIPWFLSFFLLLGFLPMITLPSSTPLMMFFSDPLANSLYYFVLAVVFVIYIAVVWLHERIDPPTRYLVMFGVMLLYAAFLLLLHDRDLFYVDSEGKDVVFHLEDGYVAIYAAEVLYDLIFAFGFVFLWPTVKKTPRFQAVLPLVAVGLALAAAIYGLVIGPDKSLSAYPYYASFLDSDATFGKVLFAGVFSAAVLAYQYEKIGRYIFIAIGAVLIVFEGMMALSMAFWASFFALSVFTLSLLTLPMARPNKPTFLSLGTYVFLGVFIVLLLLINLPGTSSLFSPYLATPLKIQGDESFANWSHYLSLETSSRLILGDGLMGFYRYNVLVNGVAAMMPFNNGFMEAYDAGGVIYLLFYLLLIFVGFYGFKKSEKHNPIFFALILGFTLSFLVYSALTSERLLFSSHYLSFVASYLFSCSTAEGKEE